MKPVPWNHQKTACDPMPGEDRITWAKAAVRDMGKLPGLDREFLEDVIQMAEVSLAGACHQCSPSEDNHE